MSVRAKAMRLARPIVGLHASVRKELNWMREVGRMEKTRSPAERHSTAVHEAGHAALQIALDLDCGGVSIISVPSLGKEVAGFSLIGSPETQGFGGKDDGRDELQTRARKWFYLRCAMVYYAGAEAVRQLIPTDPDPDAGASCDKARAAESIIQHLGGGTRWFALAKRRCALLVAHYQPEIRALADALEAKLLLTGPAARRVFARSLTGRSGQLMTLETDSMLHALAGDEAFRAFLRGTLPH
jgi:hypothetical protein